MRKLLTAGFLLLLGIALPVHAQTLLEEFQSDPNVAQALDELNAALENPSLQGPLSTLNDLSSNPKALEAIQGLQNAQDLNQLGAMLQNPFVQQYAQAMSSITNDPGVNKAMQKLLAAIQANPRLAQALKDPNTLEELLNELSTQTKRTQQAATALKLFLQQAF